MRLSAPTVILAALLSAGSSALAATLPITTSTADPTGIEQTLAQAADLDIDLSKMPAWEPVEALGLSPIKPGEGLPTLQELNMTWADLVKPAPLSSKAEGSSLTKRWNYTPTCGGMDTWGVHRKWACYHYLNGLGSTTCAVPGPSPGIRFCDDGESGSWYGYTQSGSADSSTCGNVAAGGLWVLENCSQVVPNIGWMYATGTNAAYGNGHLIVAIA